MNTTKNIAEALARIKKITKNADIIQSGQMSRPDRELLIRTNWLQEIIKGWYILVRPDIATGDSAAWYANFWDFLTIYLNYRFGNNYCLSAESSLEIYVDTSLIPKQVIAIVPKGGSSNYILPYDTSLLIYADAKNLPEQRNTLHGLQVMSLEFALCKVTPTYFKLNPENAEIALRMIKTPADLSRIIIANNFKAAANRLVGAYYFLGEKSFAKAITEDLATMGIIVKSENPFNQPEPLLAHARIRSPYTARIEALWQKTRDAIIQNFPKPPGLPKNSKQYLTKVDEIYEYDAYNSLSIEGYKVTKELIEQVKNNQWNPDFNAQNQQTRNALAARGYFEAFQAVKESINKVLHGKDAGKILVEDLPEWYRKLFLPSVQTGIIPAEHLIGYRNDRVHIRNSRHVPPPKDAVVDAMEALFNCIKNEKHPAVRAILGHYLLVFIHPYMDGNGRIARFLMNLMLISGGYHWTIIENTKRKSYMNALKTADEEKNLIPFTKFVLAEMKNSEQYQSL